MATMNDDDTSTLPAAQGGKPRKWWWLIGVSVVLVLAIGAVVAALILEPWKPGTDQIQAQETAEATAAVQEYNDAVNRFNTTDNVQELVGHASPDLMATLDAESQMYRDAQITFRGDQTMRIDSATWQPGVVTFRTCTNFMDVRFYDAAGTEVGLEDSRPTLPGKLVMEHQGDRWIATSEARVDEPC